MTSDPVGLIAGTNTYGYVDGNPLNLIDFFGLASCALITRNSLGIGTHSAFFISRGRNGKPVLYDPSGDYGNNNGGGAVGIVTGDAADIGKFADFHKNDSGDTTESICKDTSAEEEANFEDLIYEQPDAFGPVCARRVSDVIGGSKAFPNVEKGTWFPGNLGDAAK